jgi:putative ABC transport system substrate-binding protein
MIESGSSEGKIERLPGLADDLVRPKVDVTVTAGTVTTGAARRATDSIAIAMGSSADPIGNGFVMSLAHPGGNITGLSTLRTDTSPKLLEILPVEARTAPDIEGAFSAISQGKAGAIIVVRDGVFLEQRRQIAELAAKNRLSTKSDNREYVDAGDPMSYGPSLADQFRRAASYVDEILKGAKPGDLPVKLGQGERSGAISAAPLEPESALSLRPEIHRDLACPLPRRPR